MPDGSCSFLMAGGVPVVMAPAEIDVSTAGQLRAMLAAWAARGHTTLVVDMTGTEFCDSAGLSVLVEAHKRALAGGAQAGAGRRRTSGRWPEAAGCGWSCPPAARLCGFSP